MPWYDWLNKKLNSITGLVNIILIIVILISLYMLTQDNVKKSAWVVYLVSP